jgi:hypothetical protein
VRGDYVPADGLRVAGAQGGDAGVYAGVLGDDVPGAAQVDVGEPAHVLGEQVRGDVAQRAQPRGDVLQPVQGGFTLGASGVVGRFGQGAGDGAVQHEHEDADVGGQRDRFGFQVRQSMSSADPAAPQAMASWSMMLPRRPMISFSIR